MSNDCILIMEHGLSKRYEDIFRHGRCRVCVCMCVCVYVCGTLFLRILETIFQRLDSLFRDASQRS